MSVHFYVVPRIGTGISVDDAFRPKYFDDLTGVSPSSQEYGREPVMLVGVEIEEKDHATLAAQPDVVAIPVPLDDKVNLTVLSDLQLRLESMKVPALQLDQANTYREVVALIRRLFAFHAKFADLTGKTFFDAGIGLDERLSQQTAAQKAALLQAATDFGFSLEDQAAATKMRALLRTVAERMPPATMKGEPL